MKVLKKNVIKLKIILLIFFSIATTLSAIHEIEHISSNDTSSCLSYHINDNLSSPDITTLSKEIDIFHWEISIYKDQFLYLNINNKSTPTRGPPFSFLNIKS